MNSNQNSEYYGRFKDLSWFNQFEQLKVLVGGAGGIGSHLAFLLTRAGAEVFAIDNDTVDVTNLAGQLYGPDQIGMPKVEALEEVLDGLCGNNKFTGIARFISEEDEFWKKYVRNADVVCAVFDNIKARKMLYDYWRETLPDRMRFSAFIDGRMAAESWQIFTVHSGSTEKQFKAYESNFFDDSEVEEQPCSAKATTHCGSMISSFIVAQMTNWVNNQKTDNPGRTVLDRVEFHIPVMLFVSQNETPEPWGPEVLEYVEVSDEAARVMDTGPDQPL